MAVEHFARAVELLDEDVRDEVQGHLDGWSDSGDDAWVQIALNVRSETALGLEEFQTLLDAFATHARGGQEPSAAWKQACYASQLCGAMVSDEHAPQVVGRALPLELYTEYFVESYGDEGIDVETAQGMLQEAIAKGQNVSARALTDMQRTAVGRFVIWATFRADAPAAHPFDDVALTHSNVRAAFGLGHLDDPDIQLVLLAYRAEEITLHRPTIADAADFPWYRPCDLEDRHGWIQPLHKGLPRRPEVVHRDPVAVHGHVDLVLPVFLTSKD